LEPSLSLNAVARAAALAYDERLVGVIRPKMRSVSVYRGCLDPVSGPASPDQKRVALRTAFGQLTSEEVCSSWSQLGQSAIASVAREELYFSAVYSPDVCNGRRIRVFAESSVRQEKSCG
jgi:hypothetical protein